MTQKAMKRLNALRTATAKYTPHVTKKFASSDEQRSHSAMTVSAAKYYEALKKLADK